LLEVDDLVVDLHPPAPAQYHVHLFLRLVRVAVRKAIAGRDALVAEGGSLECERLGRRAELQVRRTVEPRADVHEVLLDVPQRERHRAILWDRAGTCSPTMTESGNGTADRVPPFPGSGSRDNRAARGGGQRV